LAAFPLNHNSVSVMPTAGAATNFDFTISFSNKLANVNLPQITFTNNLAGNVALDKSTLFEGSGDSIQTVNVSGSPGGHFVLNFNGVQETGFPTAGTPLDFQSFTDANTLTPQAPNAPKALPSAVDVQNHLNSVAADLRDRTTINEVQLLNLGGALNTAITLS